jgi:Tfp pilus assembly protein PilE
MRRNRTARRGADRSARGLTAITLLVVVVILAAVSGAVVVAVNRTTTRSQVTVCATDAHMLRTAVAADRALRSPTDQPTMETLVAAGFLVRPSPYHSIRFAGTTLALRGIGACAGQNGS